MRVLLRFLILVILFIASPVWGAVDLPWSTTFNCTDWDQGDSWNCDGIELGGAWQSVPAGFVTGGSTTTLIDTTVNFAVFGIETGQYIINQDRSFQAAAITSISTTTNANDTLNFSAMPEANIAGDRYYISVTDSGNPSHPLASLSSMTSASNNPLGSGKGFRMKIGDGHTVGSQPITLTFNSLQTEFWVRWYARWAIGFNWHDINGEKWIYAYPQTGGATQSIMVFPYGWDGLEDGVQGYSPMYPAGCSSCGWDTVMASGSLVNGHRTSDGAWHCFELHLKVDTTDTPDWNGVAQIWIDGLQKVSKTNMNFSNNDSLSRAGWWWFIVGSNSQNPHNGLAGSYVDIDDIAVSNTGYIGPVNPPFCSGCTSHGGHFYN